MPPECRANQAVSNFGSLQVPEVTADFGTNEPSLLRGGHMKRGQIPLKARIKLARNEGMFGADGGS